MQPADTGWLTQRPARQPQSAVPRSPPFVTHVMGYYSFNQPRRDGRLSCPCWLTDSGRLTHKVVKQPSLSLAQDRESSPARTDVLTTMLRPRLFLCACKSLCMSVCLFVCQGNYDQYVQTRLELEENQMKKYNWEQDQIAHMKVRLSLCLFVPVPVCLFVSFSL